MSPLRDNDLDRISREAAEHFEVAPVASGWDHLEKRLDQELPQKKKGRRFLFWLFFISAGAGGALTAMLLSGPLEGTGSRLQAAGTTTQQAVPEQATSRKQKAASNTEDAQPVTSNQLPGAGKAESPIAEGLKPKAENNTEEATSWELQAASNTREGLSGKPQVASNTEEAASHKPRGTSPKAVSKIGKAVNSGTQQQTTNQKPQTGNANKPRPRARNKNDQTKQNTTISRPDRSPVTDNTNITATDKNIMTEPAPVKTEPVTINEHAATATDNTASNKTMQPAVDTTALAAIEKPKVKDKIPNEKGFEFGLTGGPDLSTVKFGPVYKTGYIVGVQIGYRFNNRWSVNAGALHTKKYYKAEGKDFHYKTNWPGPWELKEVEGHCTMWEIPVNFRYDFSFNNKRRWFASTGLSTYLMDKEDYTLYYSNPAGSPYPRPFPNDSNSNYLFSIWNLSLGMERSLGSHFSLQAEPYLRVPLKGLGTGSMRMTSYGIFFTLKYKPGFRSKK